MYRNSQRRCRRDSPWTYYQRTSQINLGKEMATYSNIGRGAWWATVQGVTKSQTWLNGCAHSNADKGHQVHKNPAQRVAGWKRDRPWLTVCTKTILVPISMAERGLNRSIQKEHRFAPMAANRQTTLGKVKTLDKALSVNQPSTTRKNDIYLTQQEGKLVRWSTSGFMTSGISPLSGP